MPKNYRQSETWKREGNGFLVQVTHWRRDSGDEFEGPHRWNVYAYIYPSHPHFSAFGDVEDMTQSACTALPLHAYPSFHRIHLDSRSGKACSHQVGSDYGHLHDDQFSFMESPEDAAAVFRDADALYDWLAERALAQQPQALEFSADAI
ncbi:hypothetical protein [Delftia acidovorans]|uniref:hypothetical protein n=1 Tax=Delftia acidovorans TaxID=80866 RepID=UPI003015C39C